MWRSSPDASRGLLLVLAALLPALGCGSSEKKNKSSRSERGDAHTFSHEAEQRVSRPDGQAHKTLWEDPGADH